MLMQTVTNTCNSWHTDQLHIERCKYPEQEGFNPIYTDEFG